MERDKMGNTYLEKFLNEKEWKDLLKKVRVKPQPLVREDKGVFQTIALIFDDLTIKFYSPTVY